MEESDTDASPTTIADATSTADNPYECEYCKDTCASWAALRSHHAAMHSHLPQPTAVSAATSAADEGPPSDAEDVAKKYKCPECVHTSDSYAAMRDHLRGHVKPYRCAYCRVSYNYPSMVKSHQAKEHPGLEYKHEAMEDMSKVIAELRNNLQEYDDTLKMYVQPQRSAAKKRKRQPSRSSDAAASSAKKAPASADDVESADDDAAPEKPPPSPTTPPPQRRTRSLLRKSRPTARKSTATPVARKAAPPRPPDDDDEDVDVEIEFLGGSVLVTPEQFGQMRRHPEGL